jgi:hypothetical protein
MVRLALLSSKMEAAEVSANRYARFAGGPMSLDDAE